MRRAHWLILIAVAFAVAMPVRAQGPSGADRDAGRVLVLDVQDMQASSGSIIVRNAVGVVINPEGFVVAAGAPFGARKGGRSIRTQIFAKSPGPRSKRELLELLYVDDSQDVALLKPSSKDVVRKSYFEVLEDLDSMRSSTVRVVNVKGDGQLDSDPGALRVDAAGEVYVKVESDRPLGSIVIDAEDRVVGIVRQALRGNEYRVTAISNVDRILQLARVSKGTHSSNRLPSNRSQVEIMSIQQFQESQEIGVKSVPYERVFQAPPGFRITATDLLVRNANGLTASPVISKSLDEKTVAVKFVLTSADKRRGWFEGELRVELSPQ